MDREKIKKEVLKYYFQGYSLRQITKIMSKIGIKVHFSTVKRWIDAELKLQEKEKKIELPEDLRARIKDLLLLNNKEKGRTRTLSLSIIYKLLEMDLRLYGINSKTSWYRFIKGFIKEEFGSYEKLQRKRLDKRELSKNIISKGKLSRNPAEWEIDATGYSFNGKHYHIFICRERFSGYFLDFFIKEVKEDTGTGYYNRAFSSLDIALFLMSLFERFGLPEVIITDNEAILKTELITKGLAKLNIKHRNTVAGRPNQKLIERAFRDLKGMLRYYIATHQSFEDALRTVIESYNRAEHRFEHFNEPVVPEILHQTIKYRQAEIDEIRTAFRERFVRVVRNNSIVIDNLVYEFYYRQEERYGEYGRKPKLPEVVCYRDLENLTRLEIWDKEEKRKLGYAQLISRDVPSLDTKELKEFKNKEKRIERRKSKLSQELEKIRQEELKEVKNEEILDITSLLNEEVKEETPAQEETKQEELNEFDPLKLFIE
jgi:Integrase core domain.